MSWQVIQRLVEYLQSLIRIQAEPYSSDNYDGDGIVLQGSTRGY